MIKPMNRDTFTEILTSLYGGNRGEASIAINEFCDNYNTDPDPAELYYEEKERSYQQRLRYQIDCCGF